MTHSTTSQSQAILSTIDPATAKRHLTDWLRDAHALESQAIEIMERQLDRLQNYPELIARLRQHLEETHRQRDTVAQCLNRLGSDASTLKEVFTKFTGNLQPLMHTFTSDEVLKGVLADYALEAFEIVSYKSNIAAAEAAGEAEIANALRGILAEEEAMLHWLDQHVASLTQQYVARSASTSDREAKR